MGGRKNSPSQSLSPSPSSDASSDRRQWQRIFRALVDMVRSQQSQIEALAGDRKFFERYIKIQHERWSSGAALLDSQIAQIKREKTKGDRVEAAKLDLVTGMKQREISCYKRQFEQAESDLEDFRAYVEGLIAEIRELKEKLKRDVDAESFRIDGTNATGYSEKQSTVALEGEPSKLKHSYTRLTSQKEAEVSALSAEKDLLWNQYKKVESDCTFSLEAKRTEVEKTDEAFENLQTEVENMHSSINKKGETISRLEAECSRLELDLRRHKHEAEKANKKSEMLMLDMEKLRSQAKDKDKAIEELRNKLAKLEKKVTKFSSRKSRFSMDSNLNRNPCTTPTTPTASQQIRHSRKLVLGGSKSNGNQNSRLHDRNSSKVQSSRAANALKQCSRSERTRTTSELDGPKLFSANFKVPKLKNLSHTIL